MFYAQLQINGGALCLPIPNNNRQAGFKTAEDAKGRLESMGVCQNIAYGYDKSKGRVQVTGKVLDNTGKVLWSITL